VITGYTRGGRPQGDRLSDRRDVRIRPSTRQLQPESRELAREDAARSSSATGSAGDDCFFMPQLRSLDDLEGILDRFIVFGQTTTSIVPPRRSSRGRCR